MFAIHSDTLEQQLFIANNGPNAPELREKQKQQQLLQQRGKQMQTFTRRHALGDVSNQRRGAPVQHQPQKMVQKAAPSQPLNRSSWEAPQKLTRSHEVPQGNHGTQLAVRSAYTEQLHADTEAQAREQVYLREQALAIEQAQAREQAKQQATAWARRQQELKQIHHQQQQQQLQLQLHQQQQNHHSHPQQQPVYMQIQQQHHMQMHLQMHQPLMAMHAPTPMRKKKKKKTARRQPVVQGYYPCLSPLVENIIGELPTPARLAHLRLMPITKDKQSYLYAACVLQRARQLRLHVCVCDAVPLLRAMYVNCPQPDDRFNEPHAQGCHQLPGDPCDQRQCQRRQPRRSRLPVCNACILSQVCRQNWYASTFSVRCIQFLCRIELLSPRAASATGKRVTESGAPSLVWGMHAGILVRKSEAPGGCGWIVDFGAELGRQFFATGGASNVCHLAFANVRSSPNSPAAASPDQSSVAPLGLQASPSRANQWTVSSVESSLMTLIGTSTRLKQHASPPPPPPPELHAQMSNSIQVDLQAASQLSNISNQVANLAAQVRKIEIDRACKDREHASISSVSARAFRWYAEVDGRVKSRWRSSLSTCSETPQRHACSETPQPPWPSMTLRGSRPWSWRPCTKGMSRRRQRAMLLLLRLQVFLALNLRSVPFLVQAKCISPVI